MIDQYSSLSEKFLRKGFWLYFFGYLAAPIWYFVKILVSWEISVSDLWVLYWVISLVTLLGAFSDLWIGESLKFFIPQYIEKRSYSTVKSILLYWFLLQLISSIMLFIIFFYWAEYLAKNYFESVSAKWVVQTFSLFFLWINIFNLLSQFFLSVQNTFYYKFCEFFRSSIILCSVLFFIFFDISDLLYLSYSWIIGLYTWVILVLLLFFKKYYSQYFSWVPIIWSRLLFNKIFSYAILVFFSAQAGIILSQIDMQMIIYLLSTQDAGYYSVYLSLIMIPFLIIGPIFVLLMPLFSELSSKQNMSVLISFKHILQKFFILVGICFWVFLFSYSESIAFTLFWNNFRASWDILKYSSLFLLFNFLLQVNFSIMWWLWKIKQRLAITLIAVVINAIMNILLISYIWVMWAALATWIWWFVMFILSEYTLWKNLSYTPNLISIIKNITIFGLLWYIHIQYILPLINDLGRWVMFLLLLWVCCFWLLIFILINIRDIRIVMLEIKKIRWQI